MLGLMIFFYSDTTNFRLGIVTSPTVYTLPANCGTVVVTLANKQWVTMPQVLAYLKNWWQQQGYGIKANIN